MIFAGQALKGTTSKAEAVESDFNDFAADFNTTQSGDRVSVSGSKMTIGTGSSGDGLVDFVSTSKNPVDFSRSFEFTTTLTDTDAPDGITLTFQPDGNYAYSSDLDSGSGLCVYPIENKTGGVSNGLVTEVDTYDSTNLGTDTGTAFTDALKAHGWSGGAIIPHVAIAVLDGSGTETTKDAALVTAGSNGGSAEHSLTVKWQITDETAGTGTYSVTYDSKTISCGLDPLATFGTYHPYMTFTGSLDFDSNAGVKCSVPWGIETGIFSYQSYSTTSASLGASVKVNGETPDSAQKYDFVLEDKNGNTLQTTTSSADVVSFGDVTYDAPGTYEYYISQKKGSENGVTYDAARFRAVVTVTAVHDKLVAAVKYYQEGQETVPVFSNTAAPPEVTVSESSSCGDKCVSGNEKVKYTITVRNKGKGDATGVRVRRYMPEYTKFYAVDDSGSYGCIDQREHATWFIKKLAAGESVKLTFTTLVDVCHPDHYVLSDKVYYEVTGSGTAPYVNTHTDPVETAE